MTVTYQAEVEEVRRRLNDFPISDYLAQAKNDTTDETFYPNNINLFRAGQRWEFADGVDSNAETIVVRTINASDPSIGAQRGYQSTATVHQDAAAMVLEPRFAYGTVVAAIHDVLRVEMYAAGVYDLQYHEIQSSALTDSYAAPTTACEQFLEVYQLVSPGDPKESVDFDRKLRKVDTSLFATGKVAEIHGNWGIAGQDVYYVTCAHKLDVNTLTDGQATAMRYAVCAKLLLWEASERLSGNPSQTDQGISPRDRLVAAQQYEAKAKLLLDDEADELKQDFRPKRVFLRGA